MLAARGLALKLVAGGLLDHAPLVGAHGVALLEVPESCEGLTLAEFLGDEPDGHVLAVRRGLAADAEVFVGPGGAQKLRFGDHVLVLGTEKQLIRLGRGKS